VHIAVVGAGITGLAAALELKRRGHDDYAVYEQESVPGGLCRSHSIDGYSFDVVSHVLHFRSATVRQLVTDVLADGLASSQRDAAIYFNGRYIPYPFQTHLGYLPWRTGLGCLAGMIGARVKDIFVRSAPETFAQWIHAEFGSGIARHFMLPYNRRLWGADPAEMSLDWMRFVPRAPLRPVLSSFLSGKTPQGYNAQFLYPKTGGIQELVNAMSARIGSIRLHTRITAIEPVRKRLYFENGTSSGYDVLVSTIPLNSLTELCRDTPQPVLAAARKLRSVPIASITYGIRRPVNRSHHWVYFPHDDVPFFRLFFNSNVAPQCAPEGASLVSAEFSNVAEKDLNELATKSSISLQKLDLITGPGDIEFAHATYFHCGYPIHDLVRRTSVEQLLQHFRALDIYSIGRFGAWRYCSIEDGFLDAAEAIEAILVR
jgi:protoporphyrinogen oxidase